MKSMQCNECMLLFNVIFKGLLFILCFAFAFSLFSFFYVLAYSTARLSLDGGLPKSIMVQTNDYSSAIFLSTCCLPGAPSSYLGQFLLSPG